MLLEFALKYWRNQTVKSNFRHTEIVVRGMKSRFLSIDYLMICFPYLPIVTLIILVFGLATSPGAMQLLSKAYYVCVVR